jgi:glycosyltransferase involved in cell wall biosynthesis
MVTSVVIPALNEAGNIARVVSAARAQAVDEVIVVDNGSRDETAAAAAATGAIVVLERRCGYGYACSAGSAAAHGDILVFLDGDGSSVAAEMARLIEPLCADAADLVLGSRVLGHIAAGAMPSHQRFGNWLAARLMRGLYRVQVTDLGPYRAIRRDLLRELDMREMTFGWPTEMMVKTARRGARIHEVPVSCLARTWGRSKVGGNLRGSLLAAYRIMSVTLRYAR